MSESEVWVYVKDFPNYAVSNLGNIINLRFQDRALTPVLVNGYLRVTLCQNKITKMFYVHRLVAEAFLGGFSEGIQVSHINEDRTNNRVENIRLITGSERRPARTVEPREHSRRVRIVETGEVFRTAYDCADYIGGNASSIYRVLSGRRTHHLGYRFEYVED